MNKKLVLLKKDFLKFMVQINPSIEINQTLVLHTLLLETGRDDGISINQDEIVQLTDLNKSTVSSILYNLVTFQKHFEIFEKRVGKKKYYNCLLSYKEYMQILLEHALKTAIVNINFIPKLISRLNKLEPLNLEEENEILHTKEFLCYYLLSYNIYKGFTENYNMDIKKFVLDIDTRTKTIEQIINSVHFEDDSNKDEDSLLLIRREFLYNIIEMSADMIEKPEIILIFLAIFITKYPLTQRKIKNITQLSNGSISESLKLMLQMNLIKIIKKPKDRKKYYNKAMSLEKYGLYKLVVHQERSEQLQIAISNKFLPQIEILDIVDPNEKVRLQGELNELQSAFIMFTKYMENFFDEYKIILEEVKSNLNINFTQF